MPRPYLTMLTRVESIWTYPIEGGPGVKVESAEVLAGGIRGDRELVLGRAILDTALQYIGIDEAPLLDTIRYDDGGKKMLLGENELVLPESSEELSEESEFTVLGPYGAIPVVHLNDELDELLSRHLGMDVGLYRKTAAWHYGLSVPPRSRGDAPIRVIGLSSIADMCGLAGVEPDPRYFRPNIVVGGFRAHQELSLIGGGMLEIFSVADRAIIQIDKKIEDRSSSLLNGMSHAGVSAHGVDTRGRIATGNPINVISERS